MKVIDITDRTDRKPPDTKVYLVADGRGRIGEIHHQYAGWGKGVFFLPYPSTKRRLLRFNADCMEEIANAIKAIEVGDSAALNT